MRPYDHPKIRVILAAVLRLTKLTLHYQIPVISALLFRSPTFTLTLKQILNLSYATSHPSPCSELPRSYALVGGF